MDVWVSGKVKSKPRKKIFELQEHKWRIKSLITSRPSFCCSLAAVLIVFSRVENSSILFRYCAKEQSPAEALSGMLVYFGEETLTRVFLSAWFTFRLYVQEDLVSSSHCKKKRNKTKCVVMLLSERPLLSH